MLTVLGGDQSLSSVRFRWCQTMQMFSSRCTVRHLLEVSCSQSSWSLVPPQSRVICICSAPLGWNQMRYSKKDLPPATMDWPYFGETTELLQQDTVFMKKKKRRRKKNEKVKKITISDPPKNHQVFINYRGDQLRYNFVSHLTNAFKDQGIEFFIDNDMQPGKDLKNLFVKIEESRIALAIFSTRYPESEWCLNELVKMKKLSDEGKLHVIPIFYKVSANEVGKPTRENEFGRNFWKLVESSDVRDPIQEWREALECTSKKFGPTLRDKSSEADFIKVIVEAVKRAHEAIGLDKEVNHGGKYRKFHKFLP